ncbi:putative endopeptidase [Austwickia chelonae]|uniref:Putative metalloendopeptidase n=1 Tax=Austwickia chelonae NBRC 105200 TaxID=1184607 RepID=K6VRE9_9MICO|nr:M13-type metalloendopeptidase [Austwickia chelonae]GAB77935.1 putative metalloendopeptidase [Austwickia chelonae NBRC 105200]SEV92584.1 putative endopeptidase [Austwickia chelonae]
MRSGIDRAAMEPTIRPQDDLYGHVSAGWLSTAEIPHDRSRFGTFDDLRDRAEENMRALLEEESTAEADGPEGARRPGDLAKDLYVSFLDEDAVEQAGMTAIDALLARIDAVEDTVELMVLLGGLQREGVGGAVEPYVNTDAGQPDRYVVYLEQSGLGLPDEAYYREESYAELRERYVAHLTRLFVLAGDDEEAAGARATEVMDLETRLASGHLDRVSCRDAVKSYNLVDGEGLIAHAPGLPWERWLRAVGAPREAFDALVMRQPAYLQALAHELSATPLTVWRSWMRAAVLHAYAPYLPADVVAEHFDFYGRTLSGIPEQRLRWKRGASLVDQLLGEDAGRLYVERHFSAEAKERMITMVDNLVAAYRHDIDRLDWMTPQTRQKALAKLELFTPKIGFPDRWRDYTGLRIDRNDLLGNVRRAQMFEADRMWAKLGGPIDRDEWFMNAQTVNAYYNPGMNEIVFPAAILQPPFFDAEADDAVNYGAIGSVIGHEIGHGFDDQGSRYDGHGRLVDWWTEADRSAFEVKAAALIAQYDSFSPRDLPGEKVNGALTVGENIGDLGGVTIAHLAYHLSLEGEGAPELDGLTGDQRFFMGWARIWRTLCRPEEAKRLLSIDPHSPGEFRANIVRNLTEFYEAFDVREGDALWLPESERVRIW